MTDEPATDSLEAVASAFSGTRCAPCSAAPGIPPMIPFASPRLRPATAPTRPCGAYTAAWMAQSSRRRSTRGGSSWRIGECAWPDAGALRQAGCAAHGWCGHRLQERDPIRLRSAIRRGIPPPLRGQMWMTLTGASQLALMNLGAAASAAAAAAAAVTAALAAPSSLSLSGVYEQTLGAAGVPSKLVAEISRDVSRTFPKHQMFRDWAGAGQVRERLTCGC